ncbi:aspartate aminotransferase family protein [Sphaerobacter thermophilus]|uniref:aspartate aminotransferase family protein n=1 Tax=Sphaerobacter thermophilus TaxID=2057 RepID=UPI000DB40016|nr:MAG: aspartate aminotransferase family protein [Sphaerobacter thermophilus]
MASQMRKTIEQEYIERHPGSRERYERAVRAFPSGVTHDVRYLRPFPIYAERAQGSKKWDVDGHELIDYSMGHGALILGHSHPEIAEAVADQVRRGTHFGAGHDLEIEWGQRVCNLVPSVERVKFTSSGTEATLMAMRLARAFTGRDKIMKFAGHFHGWQDYAIKGEQPPFDGPPPPGVPQAVADTVVVAPVNDLDFVEQRLAAGDIAGVILEPSGASYATIPLPEGFLQRLREITKKHDTLLIFDEVITGFRWAPGGAQERFNVTPDLTTMAKIVAGGLPGGAVGGRDDVMALLEFRDDPGWRKVGHPGTFNANPLSAVAGATCLQMVADPRVQRHADEMAAKIRAGFNEVLVRRGVPGFCYGESSVFHVMLGVECSNMTSGDLRMPEGVDPVVLKRGPAPKLSLALHQGMINEGVDLFHGGGLLSAAHSEEDIAKTIEAFDRTVARMADEGLFSGA